MQAYQRDFVHFALDCGVLRFGEFKLKSGRVSPYFFNAGLFNTGEKLRRLGEFYAEAIENRGLAFDMLFGPAYKGIPLVSAVAIALARRGRDLPFAFNRKEAKDHGEGGRIVGSPLTGRVLIVDDVISAGTSARESLQLIDEAGARAAGLVIAVDRQERGQDARSAVQEVEQNWALPVLSIIQLETLISYLRETDPARLRAIETYRKAYGI